MRLVLDNVMSGGMAVNSSKLLLSALVAALPLAAGAITVDGSYHEFLFNNVGTFAMGCAGGCVGTINPAAEETSTPPWTFSGPARVFVLDLFQIGDEFTLFDNNAVVGNTSTVANTGASPCDNNIACAAGNPLYSQGAFFLGGGSHSLTIEVLQNATG